MTTKLHIHDLKVNPNIDGRAVYENIHIDSRAAFGAIYLDGKDIKLALHEKDEIELLLHVGKEAED
jgi:hypothetical protein